MSVSDRLLDELEWPGRATQTELGAENDGSEDEEGPSLLADEEQQTVRDKIDEARAATQRLQDEARRQLREADDIQTENLPETQEAVRFLAGTHPDFGAEYPEPAEEEKLPDDRITGPMIERAYHIMENPGRNALGIDLKETVMSGEGDAVQAFNPITSPMQAAGVVDPGRKQVDSMNEALERNEKQQKLSFWKQMAIAGGGYLLKFIARFLKQIALKIKGLFSFHIGAGPVDVTINLAKPVTAAYLWAAGVLMEFAEYLISRALGEDYTENNLEPETEEIRDEFNDVNDELDFDGVTDFSRKAAAAAEPSSAEGPKSAGTKFLGSAYRVLRSVENEARRRGSPRLARALSAFDKARVLRRDVEVHDDIARAWGASEAPDSRPTSPTPGSEGNQRLARADDDPSDFNC